METSSASELPPLEVCLADVRSCQIYVGIFAFRYGYIPPQQKKSITELEYEEAGKAGLPRLIFLLDPKASWPPDRFDKDSQRIRAFRENLAVAHSCGLFQNPDDLVAKITLGLLGESRSGMINYIKNKQAELPKLPDAVALENALNVPVQVHILEEVKGIYGNGKALLVTFYAETGFGERNVKNRFIRELFPVIAELLHSKGVAICYARARGVFLLTPLGKELDRLGVEPLGIFLFIGGNLVATCEVSTSASVDEYVAAVRQLIRLCNL